MKGLVICIGNAARGDDRVGLAVADVLDGALPKEVGLVRAPALDVALAPEVASAGTLLIVDAERRQAPSVVVRGLRAAGGESHTHALAPEQLLLTARELFGGEPQAWLVLVAAPKMGYSEDLSAVAAEAVPQAVAEIRRLLGL